GGSIFGSTGAAAGTGQTSSTTPAAPSGGVFGGGSLFGGTSATPSSSATPTTISTAPAGGSLFGGGSNAPSSTSTTGTTSSLFSNVPKPAGTPTAGSLSGGVSTTGGASTTTPATSPFGGAGATSAAPAAGSLFGAPTGSKPADSTAPKSSSMSIFGTTTSATPVAGTTTTPAPSGGLFGLPPKPAEGTSTFAPGPTTQPAAGASTTLAGSTGASTTTGTTPGTSLFGSGNLFGKPPAAPATSTTPPAPSTAGTTTTPATSLFGAKPEEKKDGGGAAPSTVTPGLGLFGAKPPATTTPAAAGTTAKPATPNDSNISFCPFLAITAAPAVAVPPPSMLRGKTLEEIVNRWSSDLETQVREFNRFAAEVAVWDRALIENGNNLTALYSHIGAAERQQDSIDQSLTHIEQQQKDLAATLDSYEKMSQELLGGQGGGLRTLDTGPADTERDKNYILATDLHTHLDDLSRSLTQMIDAVNALSVSNKPNGESNDDPVTQISQILSRHLESLQWIDGSVREVEGKVTDIERRVKDSGYSLSGSTNQSKSRGFGLGR
ncbi:Nucleoporin nsp1, partial [Leucoagaricus sp. SymC.cos]